jgi:hypothetical protein
MEAHPGIVFRFGPARRRPGLADGPDIREIARLFDGSTEGSPDMFQQAARQLNLRPEQVERAMRYDAEYRAEIDAWLRTLDGEAEREEAAWLWKHALPGL